MSINNGTIVSQRYRHRIINKERVITTEPKRGGNRYQWPWWMVQLILEMLSHRTPPSCIAPNILMFAKVLFPFVSIVKLLPCANFVCNCCSVSVFLLRLLQLILWLRWNDLHSFFLTEQIGIKLRLRTRLLAISRRRDLKQ